MALICVYSSFRLVWYKCIGKVSIIAPQLSYEHVEL